ncbi:hypothetical protein [Lactobacillus helsingborgensis]|uniref:hypothetical protein n=1 Tax=Lactobacillus helsingborgensis TaxID=1218494 RepID=UPI002264D4D0|nr:hypothetical protein [Lactobacillus helsingborgensis]UZX32173.1 hypothetical protein LDX52_03800 [Lactobacillus helsingborgensis]
MKNKARQFKDYLKEKYCRSKSKAHNLAGTQIGFVKNKVSSMSPAANIGQLFFVIGKKKSAKLNQKYQLGGVKLLFCSTSKSFGMLDTYKQLQFSK